MEKVRFGIVGCGNIGTSHAKKLTEGKVENGVLTAVCDINPIKLDAFRKVYGDTIKYYSTAEEKFKTRDCDCVVIGVPHYDHPSLAILAMDNNLHCIVEKPAGIYTLQVEEMLERAKKSDKVLGIMFNQRTNPAFKKMREMIKDGKIGEVKRTNWIITNWYRSQYYYDTGDWRGTWAGEGGGVLYNQAPHQLDLFQWIVGMMPTKIRAFCHFGKWHDIEVEDDVTTYVEYANGATGTFITTTGDNPGTNRFEITLDRAKLVAEGEKLMLWELPVATSEFTKTATTPFASQKAEYKEVETDGENPQHSGVLNAFAAHILRGEPLIAGGEEGINGLTISNAMHLSSWLGKMIDIPFDDELYYNELMKRVATSRRKENVTSVVADTSDSYAGTK